MAADDRRKLVTSCRIVQAETPVSRAGRARARFKKAMDSLVEERRVGPSLTDLPEPEMLEASTALTKRK